jgi:ABC-type nitrate/sulfonate/bicarbonate transport system ATPase subunit
MAQRGSTAVLMATHDLHEAAALASRVFVLVGGRIQAIADASADTVALEQLLVEAND